MHAAKDSSCAASVRVGSGEGEVVPASFFLQLARDMQIGPYILPALAAIGRGCFLLYHINQTNPRDKI